ncbi:MAG: DUF397 domain-containing protein [Pseudonocardiales bacterium]|nr:DUF397 domain-containing protein [Pseudonocardiales bacterium]
MSALEPDRIVWRTSSYTQGAAACVEVGWHTSSYTHGSATCVEVAPAPAGILVRDSKDPAGPTLAIPPTAWHAFLTTLTP